MRKEHLKEEDAAAAKGASASSAKNPATCDQCGITLESLSGLQHHIKSIHGAYSDREHKCDYPGCSKAYITAAALKTHYQAGRRTAHHRHQMSNLSLFSPLYHILRH